MQHAQKARGSAQRGRTRAVQVRAVGPEKLKVAVTGSGGRTGALVVKKLLERSSHFEVVAAVRSKRSAKGALDAGLPEDSLREVDIAQGESPGLANLVAGCNALVIATSAVPQIVWTSMFKVLLGKLRGQQVRPDFTWKAGQTPEVLDWLGQKAQIDAAKKAGVEHVVIISSMGGTQPDNMLNKLGNGNILLWKRKAEQYLIASGLQYTIIHPGGLIDQPGGEREIILGVDDTLLERTVRSIPRADVAELTVQCLTLPAARNRAFDAITLPPGEGTVTKDFGKLLASLGDSSCDYSINTQLDLATSKA